MDEDQKVGVFDALKGITVNGAYEYGEEDRKGTLEPGKLADLAILDANPLKVDPMAIRDIKVLETVKEGETVYRALVERPEARHPVPGRGHPLRLRPILLWPARFPGARALSFPSSRRTRSARLRQCRAR